MSSTKIVIVGTDLSDKRNILFQSALYWAGEGCKVLYITKKTFQSIPPSGHGPLIPSAEVLAKIRIVYLDRLEELMKFVVDILTFRDAPPRVIIVEEPETFTCQANTRETDHSLARLCATLCHVISCCAAHSDQLTYLLVSCNNTVDKLSPVICSMFDTLWTYDRDNKTLTRVLPQNSSIQLTLSYRNDGAFVLREVEKLFI